jgi:hypothetical protein
MTQKEKAKVLVATKTYPNPSTKYMETVCTAGIRLDDDGNPLGWIRLYPIDFRYLDMDKQFPRYAIIEVDIEKNPNDPRPESHKVNRDTIKVIEQIKGDDWDRKKKLILPFLRGSIDEIKANNESLGIIKHNEIRKIYAKDTDREWDPKAQTVLAQQNLFVDKKDLEKIPYKFRFEYTDVFEEQEVKHDMHTIDWEIMQLYRNSLIRAKGNQTEKEQEAVQKVLQKLEWMRDKRDLYFMVGDQQAHMGSYMIIGLFYPPPAPPPPEGKQITLFDLQ